MAYHGISTYQFYTALKDVDKRNVPYTMHGNQLLEHSSMKKDLCMAWLGRICTELAEGLPIGFKLELAKRLSKHLEMLLIVFIWQKMIFCTNARRVRGSWNESPRNPIPTNFSLRVEISRTAKFANCIQGSLSTGEK
jgi:hypothetical protein